MITPDGKKHLGEPTPGSPEEYVALVLVVIETPEQTQLAICPVDPRVMAGSHKVRIDLSGVIVQLAELQPVIAAHAGVGGSTVVIFPHEVVDDAAKVLLEIADVEGDIQFRRHQPRVRGIVDRAAALMADLDFGGITGDTGGIKGLQFIEDLSGRAETHETADDLVALPQQQRRGDGRIHAPGHRNQDFYLMGGHRSGF